MTAIRTASAAAAVLDEPQLVAASRRRRQRRRNRVVAVLGLAVLAVFCLSLSYGRTIYPPEEVWRVIWGEQVPGATFTVGTLRLPRAVLAVLSGLCFGLGGITFQTMLRNPLASPDIIGISSGASAAAAVAIVMFSFGGTAVFTIAIVAGLAVAVLVHLLSRTRSGGSAGTRLILVGIGVAAMLDSVTS